MATNVPDFDLLRVCRGFKGHGVFHVGTGDITLIDREFQLDRMPNGWAQITTTDGEQKFFVADRAKYSFHSYERNGQTRLLGHNNQKK